ncbi:MAG: lipopolysaccharide assembly protein LapB [Gammaproteobacteria bacterium]|nr:lipopolysaccharide assembly protein LapB [Gammaproteobacteria bacterium]MBU1655695.1 lipopolysaccharide assembly protein LapB [Gammaproteobacteria bacterium]MBU1961183.1 lipopolysaccharide assembly protein LapB [Gammaproteobacteria bacterium]
MMEILFLLLPLAAATGWYSGRRGRNRAALSRDHNPAYFKGLNLLLNEQPDKAIDVFIQLLEVDSDTVETHLALGNLFRRRGEVDRAIRIHQNLIARPTLNKEQRAQSLLELGQDYLRAGLFDRAEGLFDELVIQKLYQVEALRNLHYIYQQEKDWEKCLLMAQRLESLGEPVLRVERAHYHCELALKAKAERNETLADAQLKKALSVDKNSARATMLLGELAMQKGELTVAYRYFTRVEAQNPIYVGEVIAPLMECCERIGNRQVFREFLLRCADKQGSVEAAMALAEMVQTEQGGQAGLDQMIRFLSNHPSLRGLEHLLAMHLRTAGEGGEPLLPILWDLIRHMRESSYGYRCGQCGFLARCLHWQCPGCKTWSSIKPDPYSECQAPRGSGLIVDEI